MLMACTPMSDQRELTFAVAVNNPEVFENNFLRSPCFRMPHKHQVLIEANVCSAAKAYNDAISRSSSDLIVFAHQDVILPEPWLSDLDRALNCLELQDPRWGVLGCFGMSSEGQGLGFVYSSGRGVVGAPFENPLPVQTLDEILLIVRKSSGLRFDDQLPHFHLYGADICLRAAEMGMKSYAISAFCIHNTEQKLILPKEFYECYRRLRRRWKCHVPIYTTCLRISKYNLPLYGRKLMEQCLRFRRKRIGGFRVDNPHALLDEFRIPSQESSEAMGLSWLTRVGAVLLARRGRRTSSLG